MNGFMQLHPSAGGLANNTFVNVAMPTVAFPNWLLAPFWDDLGVVPGQTRVRSAVSGPAPRRTFTVEWFDAAFLQGAVGPERLRFQAKLYESTNVVEFHYCSMQLNGGSMSLLTGGSATVGLENGGGTEATQRSFNTAGSVTSGAGLRFVPQ
jgi:hypothetical protein